MFREWEEEMGLGTIVAKLKIKERGMQQEVVGIVIKEPDGREMAIWDNGVNPEELRVVRVPV